MEILLRSMADQSSTNREDLWGAVDRQAWRETPCTIGRAANEQDVREGRAVFYVEGPSEPVGLTLPHCGLLREENGQKLLVIIIQAESHQAGEVLIGYRPLRGGNGICTLHEVDLLAAPDEHCF